MGTLLPPRLLIKSLTLIKTFITRIGPTQIIQNNSSQNPWSHLLSYKVIFTGWFWGLGYRHIFWGASRQLTVPSKAPGSSLSVISTLTFVE